MAWLSGEVAPPDAQAARQLDLITLLKTGKVLARLAPKIAGDGTLGMKAAMGMCWDGEDRCDPLPAARCPRTGCSGRWKWEYSNIQENIQNIQVSEDLLPCRRSGEEQLGDREGSALLSLPSGSSSQAE